MQFNHVAGLVTVQEGDHVGLYICHAQDPNHQGKPERFTKIGAYVPGNRTLQIGNSSEHPILKQPVTGELPPGVEAAGAVDLLVHFDAERERAAAKAAKAEQPAEGDAVKADDAEGDADEDVELTDEEKQAAADEDYRARVEAAHTNVQIDELAAERNVEVEPGKIVDRKEELLGKVFPKA